MLIYNKQYYPIFFNLVKSKTILTYKIENATSIKNDINITNESIRFLSLSEPKILEIHFHFKIYV